MLPLAAYADRLSVRPGQTIRFHVANASQEPVTASLVRVISADANPKGPGVLTEPVEHSPVALQTPAPQTVPHGSYAVIRSAPTLLQQAFTMTIRLMPTLLGKRQAIVAQADSQNSTHSGWQLLLNESGQLVLQVANDGQWRDVVVGDKPLALRRWHFIWLAIDPPARTATLGVSSYHRGQVRPDEQTFQGEWPAEQFGNIALTLAASGVRAPVAHLNGRLERPAIFAGALTAGQRKDIANGSQADLVADHDWNFSNGISGSAITDVGATGGCHGELINTPGRAHTGAQWTGRVMDFHHAPEQYGAIHFHDDDIDDCLWPACYEWVVPQDARSSVYALMLEAGDHRENVPFHVVPSLGNARAPIAVLASTYTYTIYGNNARPEWEDPQWRQAWRDQTEQWQAYPHNPGDHPEYGLSTYNIHPDGSGIGIASWHRPMLNVRIGYITYPHEDIRGSGLRHFPTDMHLISWLEHQGHDYDIITDAELHAEGLQLLSQYRVVLTGTHPEYHTRPMLDALEQYRDQGGRLCYLGGNGFYWKIALSPERDGIIEIRRGEGGIRAWAAEPGEYYNQFDGEYGGLWRRNGRPPQDLAGVGFTAQGNFSGSYYRRQPEADDPRVAWIFNGIDDPLIGNHGLSAHGAAGFELDRADKNLGTPAHAVILASSENHPPEAPWILVPEEMLTHLLTWPRQPAAELIRADMVFFETPGGGAVFSTGSITFCGSLPSNGFDNDVSRLLNNVVTRFTDPAPFDALTALD